jgi:predicted DNA-binding transcriptional regulator AlpA
MLHQPTRPLPDAESFLHTSQLADLLHISPKTIARWAKDRLPYQRTLGGHRRDPEQAIRRLAHQPGQGGARLVSAHRDATSSRPAGEGSRIAYTVAEVAAMLGKHPNTIYEWVQRGARSRPKSSAAPSMSPSGRWPGCSPRQPTSSRRRRRRPRLALVVSWRERPLPATRRPRPPPG